MMPSSIDTGEPLPLTAAADCRRARTGRRIALPAALVLTLLAIPPGGAAQSGPADKAGYRILSYRDGAEIEIIGTLTGGVAAALGRTLKTTPQAKVVHLNSFGGLSFEGLRLFELIRSRGLVTYTSGWCYSACTTAFLGGRERWIARGARLGFHKPARAGAGPDDVSWVLGVEGALLDSYVDIPADFVRKAQSIPHETMWYPSIDELRRANVVTGVAEPDRFAATGFGDGPTPENVAAVLLKISPYDSIRRLDPAAFDALRDLWLAAFAGTRPWEDVSIDARTHLGPLFEKHVAAASDQAVIDYATATAEQMESQRGSRPDVCVALVLGEPEAADAAASSLIPFDLEQAKSAAYDEIFATAALTPQPPPVEREAGLLIDRVIRTLGDKHGSKVQILSRDALQSSQWAEACDMWVAYIREILALPPSEASRVLRHLYGEPEEEKPAVEEASADGSAGAGSMDTTRIVPRQRQQK